jgi:integral membrane sensor domain MASE1
MISWRFRRNRSLPPPHQLQSAQASAPMRHTLLCLMVAFLAAFLTPIICLLLLFIFMPGIFEGDALAWMWAFGGVQAFLGLLLAIAITVGFVVFLVARAKLSDRGWRSAQTFVIVLPFAAIVLAAATTGWRVYAMTHPPEVGPQQRGLPSLPCPDIERA